MMRGDYADPVQHARLMKVVGDQLGHDLLGQAERAKIDTAAGEAARIDLAWVERGLAVEVTAQQAREALEEDIGRIVEAARETVRHAGLSADGIDAVYFTGGSTGLKALTERLAAAFPQAQALHGDRLASVASGLGLDAGRRFRQPG